MNTHDPQLHEAARQQARASRLELYADWIVHDVDGLTFQLNGLPPSISTAVLADARAHVALALSRLDAAIERDRKAHQENAE